MYKSLLLTSTILTLFLALCTHLLSPTPSARLISPSLITFTQSLSKRWGLTGVSMAIVKGPQMPGEEWRREARGFGVGDRWGRGMGNDTLLSIASNSKIFMALSLSLLISNSSATYTSLNTGKQHRLTWETKIHDVIPGWKLMDSYAEKEMEVRDLLSHQGGLPRHDLMTDPYTSPAEILLKLQHLKPSSELRTHWQYNNMMYTISSLLPPLLTGQSFISYVQQNILDPIGMSDTYYDVPTARGTGRLGDGFVKVGFNATGCLEEWERAGSKEEMDLSKEGCLGESKSFGWYDPGTGEAGAAAGGVITTGNDITLWMQTLLSGGISPTTNLLVFPPQLLEELEKPLRVMSWENKYPEMSVMNYGMSLFRFHYRGFEVIQHFGDVPAQASVIIRVPAKGIAVAIIVNDNAFGLAAADSVLKWRVIDELLGLEPIDWESRALHDKLAGARSPSIPETPKVYSLPSSKDFKSLQRVYYNKAYGEMHLCLVPSSILDQQITSSEYCKDVLETNSWINANHQEDSNIKPKFIIATNKLWINRFILSHFDGDHFNMSATLVSHETGVQIPRDGSWPVQFDDNRFGVNGGFWGFDSKEMKHDVDKDGLEKNSEVYFHRD